MSNSGTIGLKFLLPGTWVRDTIYICGSNARKTKTAYAHSSVPDGIYVTSKAFKILKVYGKLSKAKLHKRQHSITETPREFMNKSAQKNSSSTI